MLYRTQDAPAEVVVLRIEHRRVAYRPRGLPHSAAVAPVRKVVEHTKLVLEVDLSYPVILGHDRLLSTSHQHLWTYGQGTSAWARLAAPGTSGMRNGVAPVFARIGNRDVFVVDVGAGDFPVVLHSGWIGTWEDWLPQVEALSRVTRVIAYDHRGTGRTAANPADITHDQLVQDLFDLLGVAGVRRCVLGGFSSGASVVVDAITAQPSIFAGVLLMCPVSVEPDPNFMALLDTDFDRAIELFLDKCLPEAAHRDVTSVRRWAHSVLHQSSGENAIQLMHALRPRQPFEQYAAIPAPTAVVIGAEDPMSNRTHLDGWTRLFSNARATVIPGTGHIAALTAADAVNEAFLGLVHHLMG